jgi:hypothetical protein
MKVTFAYQLCYSIYVLFVFHLEETYNRRITSLLKFLTIIFFQFCLPSPIISLIELICFFFFVIKFDLEFLSLSLDIFSFRNIQHLTIGSGQIYLSSYPFFWAPFK